MISGLSLQKEDFYLQTASASKYLACLASMTIISCCLSKKHSSADSGVRATLHLYPARSHAHQKPSLWLSSLAKISSTCGIEEQKQNSDLGNCNATHHINLFIIRHSHLDSPCYWFVSKQHGINSPGLNTTGNRH